MTFRYDSPHNSRYTVAIIGLCLLPNKIAGPHVSLVNMHYELWKTHPRMYHAYRLEELYVAISNANIYFIFKQVQNPRSNVCPIHQSSRGLSPALFQILQGQNCAIETEEKSETSLEKLAT